MKYIVELSDADGKSVRIRLSLPFAKNWTDLSNSNWQVLDEGFLKFRSGGCQVEFHGLTDPVNLLICVGKVLEITLNDFLGMSSLANDSGVGYIAQPMCITFKPGAITWALLE